MTPEEKFKLKYPSTSVNAPAQSKSVNAASQRMPEAQWENPVDFSPPKGKAYSTLGGYSHKVAGDFDARRKELEKLYTKPKRSTLGELGHTAGYYGQQLAQVPGVVADLPQSLWNLASMIPKSDKIGITPFKRENMASSYINRGLGAIGLDPTSIPAESLTEHYVGEGVKGAGATLALSGIGAVANATPLGGAIAGGVSKAASRVAPGLVSKIPAIPAGGIPYARKILNPTLLGAPETVGQMAGMTAAGGALGAAMPALQDNGIDVAPAAAALMAIPAARGVVGGVKSLAKGVKNLNPQTMARNTLLDKFAEYIPQEEMPEIIRLLKESEGKISSYGRKNTTAEVTGNPSLAVIEDTLTGQVPKKGQKNSLVEHDKANAEASKARFQKLGAVEKADVTGAEATKQHVLDQFEKHKENAVKDFPTESSDKSGAKLKAAVKQKHGEEVAKRTKEHGAPYKAIDTLEDAIPTSNINKFISGESSKYSPSSRIGKVLSGITEQLDESVVKSKKPSATELYDRMTESAKKEKARLGADYKSSEHWNEMLMENSVAEKVSHVPVKRLSTIQSDLEDAAAEALSKRRKNEARVYSTAAAALESDLINYPIVKQAKQGWAKGSEIINKIENSDILGKLLKSKKYKSSDLVNDSDAITRVANGTSKSLSAADEFLGLFGKNKEAMKSVRSQVNKNIVNSIFDANGVPDKVKVNNFLKDNEGALRMFPDLQIKLKNTQNANKFANGVAKENLAATTKEYLDMVKMVTGSDADSAVQKLFSSRDIKKIEMYKNLAATDKTGAAQEGISRSVMSFIANNSNTPTQFVKFYGRNNKAVKAFLSGNPKALGFIEELNADLLKQLHVQRMIKSPRAGSPTEPRRQLLAEITNTSKKPSVKRTLIDVATSGAGAVTGAVLNSPVAATTALLGGSAKLLWNNALNVSMKEMISRVMLDKSYARAFFQDINTANGRKAVTSELSQWRKRQIDGYQIHKHSTEEKEKEKKSNRETKAYYEE